LNESIGLGTLFLSSFLAATLLPGVWLRRNSWWAVLFIALGKFGRYCVIAGLVA
jgi:membrane protein YqaA with SNARE-associated domain